MIVGIFGGSFDPPHWGHVGAARWALAALRADDPAAEVWVLPTGRHPFAKAAAAPTDRLAMCRLAFARLEPGVRVHDLEVRRAAQTPDRPTYMIETVEAVLAELGCETPLRLVVGTDLRAEVAQWHRWPELERLAPPLWVPRLGLPSTLVAEAASLADNAPPAASSTDIRARLAAGQPIEALVPPTVATFLRERCLYL